MASHPPSPPVFRLVLGDRQRLIAEGRLGGHPPPTPSKVTGMASALLGQAAAETPLLLLERGERSAVRLRAFAPEERDPVAEDLVWAFWYLVVLARPAELAELGWRFAAGPLPSALTALGPGPLEEVTSPPATLAELETRAGVLGCEWSHAQTGNHVRVASSAGVLLDSGVFDRGHALGWAFEPIGPVDLGEC